MPLLKPNATLGAIINLLQNTGSEDENSSDILPCPVLPADLFGIAAYLLQVSGAYQFIVAPYDNKSGGSSAKLIDFNYNRTNWTRSPNKNDLKTWTERGKNWQENIYDNSVIKEIKKTWGELLSHHRDEILLKSHNQEERPAWWDIALKLMIIADEASPNVGYKSDEPTSVAKDYEELWRRATADTNSNTLIELGGNQRDFEKFKDKFGEIIENINKTEHYSRHLGPETIASGVNKMVARVMPKGRTTAFGCTMRTLSHNLALLPPMSDVRNNWHLSLQDRSTASEMNILLVPFPYNIPDYSFISLENQSEEDDSLTWGRFKLKQPWLRQDLVLPDSDDINDVKTRFSFALFIEHLIRQSKIEVHAVVLPEYALDWETYDVLVRHLTCKFATLEFIISGVSKDCNGQEGNLVVVSTIGRQSELNIKKNLGHRLLQTHSRKKHHRWCLDKSQIEAYGLQKPFRISKTEGDVLFWEVLDIGHRMQNIDVFRSDSIMTAVICEDLARIDPSMPVLRNIGPNLVFALLMDGPQLKSRWPGAYATTLADDPGSSVLSLTSIGLVDRSNKTYLSSSKGKGKKVNDTIALWKNSDPRPSPHRSYSGVASSEYKNSQAKYVEINLNEGHHAVLLTIEGVPAQETTLVGIKNSDTKAWIYKTHKSVKADPDESFLNKLKSIADNEKRPWHWIMNRPDKETSSWHKFIEHLGFRRFLS